MFVIQFLLDFLFPKRCVGCKNFGSYLCPDCFSKIEYLSQFVCPSCNKPSISGATHPTCKRKYDLDGASCGVVYRGIVKRLLYQFKYKPYVSDLKTIMGELLYEGLIQNETFFHVVQYQPVVISVPLHSNKLRIRGYNHAKLLAQVIARKLNLPFIDDILIRRRETKPQYNLDKKERVKNIKNAFDVNNKIKDRIINQRIVLVDDLATSFTTLSECAKTLKKNGAQNVWGVTFAREP